MSKLHWGWFAAAILVPTSGLASTPAPERTTAIGLMPLGRSMPPPPGFLELCGRSPQDCMGERRASPVLLSHVQLWADRERWSAAFGQTALESRDPPAVTGALVFGGPAFHANPDPIGEFVDDPVDGGDASDKLRGATPTVLPTVRPPEKKSARVAGDAAPAVVRRPGKTRRSKPLRPHLIDPVPPAEAAVSRQSLAAITRVNRRVNRMIRRDSDADLYGREDYWNRPTGRDASGDCEDYVLAKRQALIDAGTPAAALSIAVVRTRRRETHAVLLVATPEGEYVLDNLTPWVLPWTEAPYDWMERQLPGSPLEWVEARTQTQVRTAGETPAHQAAASPAGAPLTVVSGRIAITFAAP